MGSLQRPSVGKGGKSGAVKSCLETEYPTSWARRVKCRCADINRRQKFCSCCPRVVKALHRHGSVKPSNLQQAAGVKPSNGKQCSGPSSPQEDLPTFFLAVVAPPLFSIRGFSQHLMCFISSWPKLLSSSQLLEQV